MSTHLFILILVLLGISLSSCQTSPSSQTSTCQQNEDKVQQLEEFVVDNGNSSSENYLTTNFGVKIANDNFTLKAGNRGPDLLEDFYFREKIMHFDHERIPERVVHARGAAAHGYFQVYTDLSNYTRAAFLNDVNLQTPVFVRFSTVVGFKGSADTARDVRGFAVKFYTNEGNFDLVGNNIPVFFIQDAIKFPDLIHAVKPEPHNEIPQAQSAHDNFYDFASLSTETSHMIMWVLSDRGIPRSYRMMEGFGVNTYVLVNENGNRTFVKFHWLPTLGIHSLVWDEAQKLAGVDPDFHRRDLWESIDSGYFPEWELAMQLVPEGQEQDFQDFDILDATKLIPVEQVPLITVGKLVLNRNPDNFFAETEQVAYDTSHLVSGIEASDDPLLQGRMFSYFDTQLLRLGGSNFEEIPINQPLVPVTNNERDGFHRQTINRGTVNYFPNRFSSPVETPVAEGGYRYSPTSVSGNIVYALGPKFKEHFNQARLFYNSLTDWEQQHLIQAAQFELAHVVDQGVRERMVDLFNHIDFNLAVSIANAIAVTPPTTFLGSTFDTISANLSQNNTIKNKIVTFKIAFLIAPGYNSDDLHSVISYLKSEGAIPVLIGPTLGYQSSSSDWANATFYTTRSVQYDGLVLVGGTQYSSLKDIGVAVEFVLETFKHYKGIVALDEAVQFLEDINLVTDSYYSETENEGVLLVPSFSPSSDFTQKLIDLFGFRHYERDISSVTA